MCRSTLDTSLELGPRGPAVGHLGRVPVSGGEGAGGGGRAPAAQPPSRPATQPPSHPAAQPLNPASPKPKPVPRSLEPVKCPKCGKQFKDKNGLVGHEPICPMCPSTGKFLPLGQLQRKNFHNPFLQICLIIAELLFAFLPQQMWILLVLCRRVYDALVPFKPPKPQIPIIVEHVGNDSDDNLDSGEWMWGGSIDSGLGEPTAHVTGSIGHPIHFKRTRIRLSSYKRSTSSNLGSTHPSDRGGGEGGGGRGGPARPAAARNTPLGWGG